MLFHPEKSRGKADHGWLKSAHTFSFADYYDAKRMGFGVLRVINDDQIAPGMGFGTHPHRDMEIITVPLKGSLAHKDSMGNASTIHKGEVQVMSAGTGILHSEFNASENEICELLQIWVRTKKNGVEPRYQQKEIFSSKDKKKLIVSPDGREDSVWIHQDAFFTIIRLDAGEELSYQKYLKTNGIYCFLIEGKTQIQDQDFSRRDGAGFVEENELKIKAFESSELLVMEIPL